MEIEEFEGKFGKLEDVKDVIESMKVMGENKLSRYIYIYRIYGGENNKFFKILKAYIDTNHENRISIGGFLRYLVNQSNIMN